MSSQVEISGAYQLPQSVSVTQGCLGKSFRIEVGGRVGKATLPGLVWQDSESGQDPEPVITFGQMDPELENALGQRLKSPNPLWPVAGRVTAYNPKKRIANECHIGAIFLRFSVQPEDVALPAEAHGRTSYRGVIPIDIRDGVAPWFYRLRMWIEAAVDQDIDPDIPLVAVSRGRLSLFTNEEPKIGELGSWAPLQVMRHDFEPVNLQRLRRIVAHANAGRLPSDAHLLMRDARAALRRQRTRVAVIDAGAAVELTLAEFNRGGPNFQQARGRAPTLGWYVNRLLTMAQLPSDTQTALVTVRNDAAHGNRYPTRAEAVRALDVGKEIVERLDPLPV